MAALAFSDNNGTRVSGRTLPDGRNGSLPENSPLEAPAAGLTDISQSTTEEVAAPQPKRLTEISIPPPKPKPRVVGGLSIPSSTPLPMLRRGLRSVDANVGEILDRWVVFYCEGAGPQGAIRLPRDIVPDNVLAYGQPVRITLNSNSGIRFPDIQPRTPIDRVDDDEDDVEIDEWLKSL